MITLGPVEAEVARKRETMVSEEAVSWPRLQTATLSRLGAPGVQVVEDTLGLLREVGSVSPDHPSMSLYLDHPIRIAAMLLETEREAPVGLVQTALLHNAYEVAGIAEQDLVGRGVGPDVAAHVRLLTIDRDRETEHTYLVSFHAAVEAAGPDLALIRVLDKLDNLLGLEALADGELRRSYLDLAVQYVQPMAARLSPALGEYFASVAAYMRIHPCREDLRRRYQALVAGAGA